MENNIFGEIEDYLENWGSPASNVSGSGSAVIAASPINRNNKDVLTDAKASSENVVTSVDERLTRNPKNSVVVILPPEKRKLEPEVYERFNEDCLGPMKAVKLDKSASVGGGVDENTVLTTDNGPRAPNRAGGILAQALLEKRPSSVNNSTLDPVSGNMMLPLSAPPSLSDNKSTDEDISALRRLNDIAKSSTLLPDQKSEEVGHLIRDNPNVASLIFRLRQDKKRKAIEDSKVQQQPVRGGGGVGVGSNAVGPMGNDTLCNRFDNRIVNNNEPKEDHHEFNPMINSQILDRNGPNTMMNAASAAIGNRMNGPRNYGPPGMMANEMGWTDQSQQQYGGAQMMNRPPPYPMRMGADCGGGNDRVMARPMGYNEFAMNRNYPMGTYSNGGCPPNAMFPQNGGYPMGNRGFNSGFNRGRYPIFHDGMRGNVRYQQPDNNYVYHEGRIPVMDYSARMSGGGVVAPINSGTTRNMSRTNGNYNEGYNDYVQRYPPTNNARLDYTQPHQQQQPQQQHMAYNRIRNDTNYYMDEYANNEPVNGPFNTELTQPSWKNDCMELRKKLLQNLQNALTSQNNPDAFAIAERVEMEAYNNSNSQNDYTLRLAEWLAGVFHQQSDSSTSWQDASENLSSTTDQIDGVSVAPLDSLVSPSSSSPAESSSGVSTSAAADVNPILSSLLPAPGNTTQKPTEDTFPSATSAESDSFQSPIGFPNDGKNNSQQRNNTPAGNRRSSGKTVNNPHSVDSGIGSPRSITSSSLYSPKIPQGRSPSLMPNSDGSPDKAV